MRTPFATKDDIEVCRALHRQHGTTYYFATLRFPTEIKWRVHGLYAFVRIADEWIDNPGGMSVTERREKIESWREAMVAGANGVRPSDPAMRVFCDAVIDCKLPLEEAHCFLDAMIMDLEKTRYDTYEELCQYMRGSASAVGVLMCYAMGAFTDHDTLARAKSLGEAMQLTNFLRDIAEDFDRGRIYLPKEDLVRFGVTEQDIASRSQSANFRALMKFEIERARDLYAQADPGIQRLPEHARKAVLLARLLYSQILNRIEDEDYNVFARRLRTNLSQKAACATKVVLASNRILQGLTSSGSAT